MRECGYIADLCVHAECRGLGLGRRLYERLRAWFLSRGIESIEVQVVRANPASQTFWRKMGFSDFLRTLRNDLITPHKPTLSGEGKTCCQSPSSPPLGPCSQSLDAGMGWRSLGEPEGSPEDLEKHTMPTIAILPGDGIGPEIMHEGVKVLQAAAKKHDIPFGSARGSRRRCGL